MKTISVIGLGAMGSALAGALLKNGYDVTVWNRSPEKASPLVQAGATLAAGCAEAIAASPATITCIKSHSHTRELLAAQASALHGKTIIELSTGEGGDAEALAAMLGKHGAHCLIGMINAYPSGVGKPDTTIITVGPPAVWDEYAPIIKALGGKSTCVGDKPAALAALFAALFSVRQGFMFGMIFGALTCRKAGIPLDAFANQIPVSMKLTQDYYELFAASVPNGNYADPGASMATFRDALDDALGTIEALGARDELLRLFRDLAQQGVDAGCGNEELTALVKVLG